MEAHEIVSVVLELVDDEAYSHAARRVSRVHLALGGRRAIDLEQLKRDFERSARGTVAEGAELCIEVLPVHRHCQGCGKTFLAEGHDQPCPACGHPHTEPLDGEEARLVDIVVDDVVTA